MARLAGTSDIQGHIPVNKVEGLRRGPRNTAKHRVCPGTEDYLPPEFLVSCGWELE